MNGKMTTLTFFEFYTVYLKKARTILFPYLLTYLNKDDDDLKEKQKKKKSGSFTNNHA